MITPLAKATLVGPEAQAEEVLEGLQQLGFLHLIPTEQGRSLAEVSGASAEAREALRFLKETPQRRRQAKKPQSFDPLALEHELLELKKRLLALRDERDFLLHRLENLGPFGNFEFPPLEELGGHRLWFYQVPHYRLPEIEATGLAWQEVARDNLMISLAVVSVNEPKGMPVERVRVGSRSPRQLRERLDEVEAGLEEAQAQRWRLTRFYQLYAANLDYLDDLANLKQAHQALHQADDLYRLSAWVPRPSVRELEEFAQCSGAALLVRDPDPGEEPPTLMENSEPLRGGQSLVSFYMVPNYRLWDPSVVVYFSFAVFFAMILSDAGYSLLMLAVLALSWRSLGKSSTGRSARSLLLSVIVTSTVWGVLVGSYFGVEALGEHPLAALHLLDLHDFDTMMVLSTIVGIAHLGLGLAIDWWRQRSTPAALTPLGWLLALLGSGLMGLTSMVTMGEILAGAGLLLVVLFSAPEKSGLQRLGAGLLSLTRIPSLFGDVLSYLRLFALGLASASLAIAFNDLAFMAATTSPYLGKLLALLVLLVGHILNFALALMAGVVHGLRLNFIEFFNWSVPEEGYAFRAFSRKGAH